MPKLRNSRREFFACEVAAATPLIQAYKLAGYRNSRWGAYNASKLAHHPAVAERITELQREFADRAQLRAEYLQRLLLPLVEANVQDAFVATSDATGRRVEKLRPITELPRALAAAIQRIKIDPESGAVTAIDFHNKVESGSTLLRSIGGLIDRLEVNDPAQMNDADFVADFVATLEQLGKIPPATIEQVKKGIEMSLGIIDGTTEPVETSTLPERDDAA